MALIKKRLGLDAVMTPGGKGQFDVVVDGETIAERRGNWFVRSLGAGYPDLRELVARLEGQSERVSEEPAP